MADLGDIKWPDETETLGNPFIKAMSACARWSGEQGRPLKKYWY
jgi:hypothetical protein